MNTSESSIMTTFHEGQGDSTLDNLKFEEGSSTANATPSALSLLWLPNKDLLQICLHLGPEEAANFRATNKLLRALASANTFKEIHMFHCDDDFSMVQHLADEPVYSKCIKSLILDGNVLPIPPPFEEYKAARMLWEFKYNLSLKIA